MKLELRSISLWSFIKISVFVNLIMGFIGGLFYALFLSVFLSLFSGLAELGIPDLQDADMPLGFLLIAMPIMGSLAAAFFGTLWGIVCVLTYNLVTMLTGGLQINVDDVTVDEPRHTTDEGVYRPQHGQPSAAAPPRPPEPLNLDDDDPKPTT